MISRYGPLALLVLVAVSMPAVGQPTRIGGGLTLGLTPNLAEGFSTDQVCPHRSAFGLSARATFALTRIIQFEALGEVLKGPPASCASAPLPPPPPVGPYSLAYDYYEQRITDPPTILSLRVGGMLPQASAFTLRPYIGIARFSGKGITSPQAGLTILGGGRQLRLLLEIEGWWYSVPELLVEEEYFDGQLVERSVTGRGVRSFTTILRLGFTRNVGRS